MHDKRAFLAGSCLVDETQVECIGAGREVGIFYPVLYRDGAPVVVNTFEVILISL